MQIFLNKCVCLICTVCVNLLTSSAKMASASSAVMWPLVMTEEAIIMFFVVEESQ